MKKNSGMRSALQCIAVGAVAALMAGIPAQVHAQARRGAAPAGPPPTAEASAPIDLTGYWVSVIVDEWRFRVEPQKGDILYIPLNQAGRQIAEAWNPAKDAAEGKQCKAYGAIGVMQRPGRLHITWQDPNTLRIDTDAGKQTRLLHFESPGMATQPAAMHHAPPSWQGFSVADWDEIQGRGFGGVRRPPPAPMEKDLPENHGSLKVVTTDMLPGYLRLNGAPYSANAVYTEYFDLIHGEDGQQYMVLLAEVADPTYMNGLFVRTYQFKKLPDGQGWDPTPCWNK